MLLGGRAGAKAKGTERRRRRNNDEKKQKPPALGAARLVAGPEPMDAERRRMLSPDPGLLASPHAMQPPRGRGSSAPPRYSHPKSPQPPGAAPTEPPLAWRRARDARVVAALKCGSGRGGAGVRGGGGTALLGAPRAAGAAAAPQYPANIMRI